jgi:hypothetical protein
MAEIIYVISKIYQSKTKKINQNKKSHENEENNALIHSNFNFFTIAHAIIGGTQKREREREKGKHW